VEELKLIKSKTFLLQKAVAKAIKEKKPKTMKEKESVRMDCNLAGLDIQGSKLIAWGHDKALDDAEKKLNDTPLRWLKPLRTAAKQEDNCGLCKCELDEENVQLQKCLHKFCLACFDNLPFDTESFPIKCPECLEKLSLVDLRATFPNQNINRMKSLAP